MPCRLCTTLAARAASPRFVGDLVHTAVFLGERQNPRGWCVLVLRSHAEHLADLPPKLQRAVFGEVAHVAAAIRAVFPESGPRAQPPRINYECLGNQVPHIHWHVIPRHADDPHPRSTVWHWPRATIGPRPAARTLSGLAEELRAAMRL